MKSILFCLICFPLTALATGPDVIYGEDNRKDTFESPSYLYRKLAKSTAAMVNQNKITIRGQTAELHGTPLTQFVPRGMPAPVCEKERFSSQPTTADCSGFLVAENIIATAGHCMTSIESCTENDWVFNYKVSNNFQTSVSVDVNDVYKCKRIIKQSYSYDSDFALIEIDRPIKGRALRIAQSVPAVGTPLVMIGHPSGLPQKISDGSKIISVSPNGFEANLDAFGGNSGSAVFNAKTGEIVGILVNGNQDYRYNSELNCSEVNLLPEEASDGEGVSSFKQFSSYL